MKKNLTLKKILIVFGIVIAVLAVGFFYRSKNNEEINYTESPVVRDNLTVTILATGTVQPKNRLSIKAPVAGRMDQILVKEGDQIKKGQILAYMSSSERAAMLDAARAGGVEEYKKWSELFLATPVIAPINGTLILKSVEPGQSFTTADAILVMSDMLTVKAQVDETDISQVKIRGAAEIILDAYQNSPMDAVVDQIAFDATVVNNVTTYVVDVVPEKAPEFMRSGMTANVRFILEDKKNVLVVPTESIRNSEGKTMILVKDEKSGKPKEIEISTGISDGRQTEVTQGLQGQEILLLPEFKLNSKGEGGGSPFVPQMRSRRGR